MTRLSRLEAYRGKSTRRATSVVTRSHISEETAATALPAGEAPSNSDHLVCAFEATTAAQANLTRPMPTRDVTHTDAAPNDTHPTEGHVIADNAVAASNGRCKPKPSVAKSSASEAEVAHHAVAVSPEEPKTSQCGAENRATPTPTKSRATHGPRASKKTSTVDDTLPDSGNRKLACTSKVQGSDIVTSMAKQEEEPTVECDIWKRPEFREQPLEDLLLPYQKHLASRPLDDVSPDTIVKYLNSIKSFIRSLQAHNKPTTLESLTKPNVLDWIYYQKTGKIAGQKEEDKGSSESKGRILSEAGIASRLSALKVFSNTYVYGTLGATTCDPLNEVKRIKARCRSVPEMGEEARQKILNQFDSNTFEGVRNRAIVAAHLSTGLRKGAVLDMQISRMNQLTGRATVVTKGDKELTVVLSPKAMADIRKYLKMRPKNGDPDRLWLKEDGQPLTRWGVQSMFRRLQAATDIGVTPQRIRHEFAKGALRKGASRDEIRNMMGHESATTTDGYLGDVGQQMSAEKMPEYGLY
jgi:site-specific recombinase XerD